MECKLSEEANHHKHSMGHLYRNPQVLQRVSDRDGERFEVSGRDTDLDVDDNTCELPQIKIQLTMYGNCVLGSNACHIPWNRITNSFANLPYLGFSLHNFMPMSLYRCHDVRKASPVQR